MTNDAVIPTSPEVSTLTVISNHHHRKHRSSLTPILPVQHQLLHHHQARWSPYRRRSISSSKTSIVTLRTTCILATRKIPCAVLHRHIYTRANLHRDSGRRSLVVTVEDVKSVDIKVVTYDEC